MNQLKETRITSKGTGENYLALIWSARELLFFFAWRDILVRYKQTFFGIGWALFLPLATMIVLTFVFGGLAKLSSGALPYFLVVYAGLLPWQFFSSTLNTASNSLVTQTNLVSKVYFPRIIMPMSSAVVVFVDSLIAFILFVILALIFGVQFGWNVLLLPLLFIMILMLTLGCSFILSAVNVKYRDIRYIAPFIIQFGLFLSPVGFLSEIVPKELGSIFALNPMVGIIDGFRFSLLGIANETLLMNVLFSLVISFAILVLGTAYFKRVEKEFADVI